MKKICIVGHFGIGKELTNGQTIKTKIIYDELKQKYGSNNISYVDTHLSNSIHLIQVLHLCIKEALNCENIMIMPANNGIKFFCPLIVLMSYISKVKTHYVVIGGWLPSVIKKRILLKKILKKINYIYVETNTMKNKLIELGFENIILMENFKRLNILEYHDLNFKNNKPFKLCTFSRVMKEKGIDDIVNAVNYINSLNDNLIYTLDIFGPIDENQIEWFNCLQSRFSSAINYKGIINYDESVDTLKSYFGLVFPTRFYTEGIPGTILDSFASGVPIIYSKWESCEDILKDGYNGYGYEFSNQEKLVEILIDISQNPYKMIDLRGNCLYCAQSYLPENSLKKLRL